MPKWEEEVLVVKEFSPLIAVEEILLRGFSGTRPLNDSFAKFESLVDHDEPAVPPCRVGKGHLAACDICEGVDVCVRSVNEFDKGEELANGAQFSPLRWRFDLVLLPFLALRWQI